MFVGDLFDHEAAVRRFIAKAAHSHATVRESVFDRIGEPKRFVRMNVIIRGLQCGFL
jgi:hypothetical protein